MELYITSHPKAKGKCGGKDPSGPVRPRHWAESNLRVGNDRTGIVGHWHR